MNKTEKEQGLKLVASVVGAFFAYKIVVKPLLEGLGLKKTDTEIANENAQLAETAWNPLFWQSAPNGSLLKKDAYVSQEATKIYDSLGFFSDDYDTILASIRNFKTKTQVSQLADKFQQLFGLDLYAYLTNGNSSLPGSGLSTAHLATINEYVRNLPNYN
jgi:hypothetical protein